MTDAELNELETLANAATPGDWQHEVSQGLVDISSGWEVFVPGGNGTIVHTICNDEGCKCFEDAAFIAAARKAVPELIAEVRRLRRATPSADPST